MRVERLVIAILGSALGWALWKLYRGKLREMWHRVKDQLPLQWRPKSPKDCPLCQADALGLTDHIWTVEEVLRKPLVTPLGGSSVSRTSGCAAFAT